MIPNSVRDITHAWLNDVLRSALGSGNEIAEYEIQPLNEFGIMSSLWRVSFGYSSQSLAGPKTLVVKLPSADPRTREMGHKGGFYEREVRFYNEIASVGALPVPRLYYAESDPVSGKFVLVLEDLGSISHGDQEAEANMSQVRTALTHLARMHAAWWESPRLADAQWLLRWPDSEAARHAGPAFEGSWRMFLENRDFPIPAELRNSGGEIGQWMPKIAAEMGGAPRTLLHGDFHPPNVYFDASAAREVIAVDWQVAAHGRCVFDAACVLATWISSGTRRTNGNELLAYYHQKLLDQDIGGYTLEDCIRDYRLSVVFLFINTVFTRLSFAPQSDLDRRVMGEAWRRIASAAGDVISE